MIYKDFQNLRLPMLGFGSMRLPLLPGGGDGAVDEAAVAAVRTRLMEREAAALVRSLRQMGLTRPEAEALIDRLWDSPELEEEKP